MVKEFRSIRQDRSGPPRQLIGDRLPNPVIDEVKVRSITRRKPGDVLQSAPVRDRSSKATVPTKSRALDTFLSYNNHPNDRLKALEKEKEKRELKDCTFAPKILKGAPN